MTTWRLQEKETAQDDGLLLSKPEHLEIDFRMMAADEGRVANPVHPGKEELRPCCLHLQARRNGLGLSEGEGGGERGIAQHTRRQGSDSRGVAALSLLRCFCSARFKGRKQIAKHQKPAVVHYVEPRAGAPQTVTAQCTDSEVIVTISPDLLGIQKPVQPSDLSMGGCGVTSPAGAQPFVIEAPLQGCGSTVEMLGALIVYTFSLDYNPSPIDGLPIVRTNPAVVQIECQYNRLHNVSSNALNPTWVPYTSTISAEDVLGFSLVIMSSDWSGPSPSNTFFLGDLINLQAPVDSTNHEPLRVFVDRCVATPGSNASAPAYTFIGNNGCFLDSQLTGSNSQFVSPRVAQSVMQFQLDAFRFYGLTTSSSSQYVVTIAVGSRSNLKTFTCPKPGRRVLKLPADRCAVVDSEKLPCGGSSSITQADCEASNCCYDSSSSNSPCYYANDVTVQCTLDGQFVVVVSENVTLPSLDLGSIQLVDSSSPSCSPVTSLSSFVMYQFPVSACGSTVQKLKPPAMTSEIAVILMSLFQLSGGNVTYQNTMSAAITVRSGPEGSITRDSVYKLFFQCTYSGSQDVQVEAEVYTVAPPLPVVEQGPFDLELVIATDSSYGSYYMDADYPVTKTLRDPVAVEVHIVNRTDPNLVLTLGDCWVTPGPSASSQPQWSLLVNGCPYAGDNYLTSLVTVDSTSGVDYPSHYKRFVFEMFAFVDPVAQQALAEKVGFFVEKGNPALFLWSCLKYCDGLKFGDRCMDTNQ
ncbi:ZP4 protein, partial [Polypterus senegalus]